MSATTHRILKSLEARRALLFTIAGVVFAADLVMLLYRASAGMETQFVNLSQAFIGAAWAVGFLGLLGFYPTLSDRGTWLPRIGGAAAVVGFLAMVVMTVVSFGVFVDVLSGGYESYVPLFLPGIIIGIIIGYGTLGVATLRSGVYAPLVGALFLVLVCTFVFNVGTGIAQVLMSISKVIGVVTVLTVTNLALGYLVLSGRAEPAATDASASDSAV